MFEDRTAEISNQGYLRVPVPLGNSLWWSTTSNVLVRPLPLNISWYNLLTKSKSPIMTITLTQDLIVYYYFTGHFKQRCVHIIWYSMTLYNRHCSSYIVFTVTTFNGYKHLIGTMCHKLLNYFLNIRSLICF